MAENTSLFRDNFSSPTALNSLKDLLSWLVLRQNWEESMQLEACDCMAQQWSIMPHEDDVYVEVITGINGQDLLHKYPGFATLPVIPGEKVPLKSGIKCEGHAFYFGPFSDEHKNL